MREINEQILLVSYQVKDKSEGEIIVVDNYSLLASSSHISYQTSRSSSELGA